jgi:hypothetical protein
MSDYGLDDRAIKFDPRQRRKDFSPSLCVQTGSEAHPASYLISTGGKVRKGCDADDSPPSSAEVVNEELYLLSPQAPSWRVAGLLDLFNFISTSVIQSLC